MQLTPRHSACAEKQAECAQAPQTKRRDTRPFWEKVRRGTDAECWPWLGYTKSSGHGLTQLQGKSMHASRKAWILANGIILNDLCVNHKCGNALCCNPTHMYLRTRAENMGDRFGTDGVTLVSQRRRRRVT
jgi:hypothetical protein